ncbi:Hypothetical protein CINCED_3A022873 [Cinara cedri]|uniref:FP protein C-terminal domain-containing protein n=1 Tax=Cinara cedri TaxID=506608 RepID=A0A5E4MHS0_9HEMI|nr:Hypothetical protein CINCED_3A022873 [Cinara cedri]
MSDCNSCCSNIIKAYAISCGDCNLTCNRKCQKCIKEDMEYLNGILWRCRKCTATAKRISLQQFNKQTNFRNVDLIDIRNILIELKGNIQSFKEETGFIFDDMRDKFNVIDNILEFSGNSAMKSRIQFLENKIENLERRYIANDIFIDGVPELKLENCNKLVKRIGTQLNTKITDSYAHRMDPRQNNNWFRKIFVSFTNHQNKTKGYNACKVIKNLFTKRIDIHPDTQIYKRKNLTTKSSHLFKEARCQGKQYNYKVIWIKNGLIFRRKNEPEKIIHGFNEEIYERLAIEAKQVIHGGLGNDQCVISGSV